MGLHWGFQVIFGVSIAGVMISTEGITAITPESMFRKAAEEVGEVWNSLWDEYPILVGHLGYSVAYMFSFCRLLGCL